MLPIKNRGMFLETILNLTNQKYQEQNLCLVSKIPTNFRLTTTSQGQHFNYDQNFNCDYIGCYQGHYFEFEAKQTQQKSFALKNFRPNQITKLNLVIKNHGLGFLIIYFSFYNRYFFVDWKKVKSYLLTNKKTIPLEWFIKNGIELFVNNQLILDYLDQINHLINYTL